MLEFNVWFIVLLVNFLLLVFILNKLLFQPILKVFNEREEAIDGSLDAAKKMGIKKEEALARMKAELAEAAQQARAAFEERKAEGQAKSKELLEAANSEAAKIIGDARAKLKAESDRARGALRADVEKFSEEIANKLISA